MKNINIGIANLIVSKKLNESYLNDISIEESKKNAFDFFDVIKKSPILQLEFKVFNNIEGKYIENDMFAKEYIDNNIKLFEIYTLDEVNAERIKLKKFINEDIINENDERVKLYVAINNLIDESLKISDDVDVDKIHESFTFVFNHIKNPKKELIENIDVETINEDVIEIAINKFNKKYSSLNESDKDLLKTLIKSNNEEKKSLLEIYKSDTLNILEGINKENVQDNINKAIKKIKEMNYNQNNVDNNIIGLYELKKELL